TELLALAGPGPAATHISIVRKVGADRRSEYHALNEVAQVMLRDGDEVSVTSDKYPGTILVRIEGANLGERSMVLPYGARLQDPRGQVVLGKREQAEQTLLEDGDVLRIPERSNLVLVSGEVLFPNALVWQPGAKADDYVKLAGGYNQGADQARVLVVRQD